MAANEIWEQNESARQAYDVEGDESPVLESKRRKRAREGREPSRRKEQSKGQVPKGMQACVPAGAVGAGDLDQSLLSQQERSDVKLEAFS